MMNFDKVDALLQSALGVVYPAAQLVIFHQGECVFNRAIGWHDPAAPAKPIDENTRFDLASVSKLFTVAAFMRLVEAGKASLDQPVSTVLHNFAGMRPIQPQPDPAGSGAFIDVVPPTTDTVDASLTTFRQLLTHTSGLPAWLPLWKEARAMQQEGVPADVIQQRMRDRALQTAFAYPAGRHVIYSDVGLIITGWAIEKIAGQPLDGVVREQVAQPLGLDSIRYSPIPCDRAAPTEYYAHQGRRMCGEVHDENAWALNSVAGHAGLFSHARDVAAFGEAMRLSLAGTSSFLKRETLQELTRLQAQDGDVRRGIGFALWSPNPQAMSHALSQSAFGHLGFTGTALWIDPERALTFACLTNHIYYGRAGEDTMTPFRAALSKTVGDAL
jgi:CubicO group peptidase (beta-lactamase class C family)